MKVRSASQLLSTLVGLRCGGGIQLDQIIFEHAFNIWLEADTFLRFSASRPTDNTSPNQTKPAFCPRESDDAFARLRR